ncbi:replicative DNA helicase [candidate division WOR-3 bacterium]|nr:replicative DNA helicase [candidate division WOR-3 bacterium]
MATAKRSVLPSSPEAEAAVIASCMLSSDSCSLAAERLTAEDFFVPAHKIIYQAIMKIFNDTPNPVVDLITVGDELRRMKRLDETGGIAYLAELESSLIGTAASNTSEYIKRVKDTAIKRRLIDICQGIVNVAMSSDMESDEQLDNAESLIFRIRQEKKSSDFDEISEIVHEAIKEVDNLYQNKGKISGIETHYPRLDQATRGLQRQEFIVLAARPGMGKTAFALNIATEAAIKNKVSILIFSLEMNSLRIVSRMISSLARVDSQRVNTGFISHSDFDQLTNAASKIASTDIYIDDSSAMSILEVKAKARRKADDLSKRGKKLGLVIIDYLQLIRYTESRVDNRQQEVANISMALKALSKELDVPVLALSQLSRASEMRTERKPQLSDLRESGAIEQDSDVVMFLHRDYYYSKDEEEKNKAELIIAKNRNGPTDIVKLHWTPEYLRFDPIDVTEED